MTIAASLSSPTIFNAPLAGLARASSDIYNSTARLSTGNRLINAGDDVAALSISSRLQTQVTVLRSAQSNATQGNSFLQVAYGALLEIRDVLERMDALAAQANSGSLTTNDRALLQQEFSALYDEVDRLANNTQFNEINLLDGTVSGENRATTTTTQATQSTGSITLTGNPGDGDTIVLSGVTFTARAAPATATEFAIGGSISATVANLETVLLASTNKLINLATYEAAGNSISITYDSGGTSGNQFVIFQNLSTASFTTSGATTNIADVYTLQGGLNDGLYHLSTLGVGTVGDSLVLDQSFIAAQSTLTITGTISDGETLSIDDANGGLINFTFRNTASSSTEIQIGADTSETIQNIISTLEQYTGTDDYGIRQLEYIRDGNQLTIKSKGFGDPRDLTGTALNLSESISNASLSTTTLDSGEGFGIDTRGINNGDFVGTIGGFTATYVGADSITLSLTVGSSTYTAALTDTTPGSNTTLRFNSTNGGYFDVDIASGGLAVTNQTDANTFATRLNAAFGGLSFYQERIISNFTGVNNLAGASAVIRLNDFSDVELEDIQVTAPAGAGLDGIIEVTVNGEIFRSSSGIGGSLGAYETFTLTNINDSSERIRITNGSTTNDFSSASAAATFESTLRSSFGLSAGGVGLDFQVGYSTSDKITVNIADVRNTKLFDGTTPDISTQSNAVSAATALDTALQRVNVALADVGAYQARFDVAYDNLDNTILYVDQARSDLADTDIAAESINFALAQLRANSAVAVIAQTSQLQSSLLDVLKLAG